MTLALGCGEDPEPAIHACPSGSIAQADGTCMQAGIQGCADMFIDEDGLCRPSMDKCPAGTIPKFDEGCVPVGIQGCAEMFMEADGLCHPSMSKCPAGMIPKFEEGCVPVGIQGCAEVFMEQDGLCHPSMDKCPAGTFAVPQQGCLPIDGPEGCGSGTWGNIQEDPNVATIWVDPSAAAPGDGSQAAPVKTIAEALALVPTGGRIALGTGTYDEPIHITKPMTVEGRCPSMVRVQGTASNASGSFVVWLDAADNVTLRRLEIGGAGAGVVVTDAAGVTIEEVHIRSATTYGIGFAGWSTTASVTMSWIDGTFAGADGLAGYGAVVGTGARVTFAESALVANHEFGVATTDIGTELALTDTIVEGTYPRELDGRSGRGIELQGGASLMLADSAVVKNHEGGVNMYHVGTRLTLTNSLVEDTRPSPMTAQWGVGVTVATGAEATLSGAAILSNHHVGVGAISAGTEMTVSGCLVEGTRLQQSDGDGGVGVSVQPGARLKLIDSAVVANRTYGLVAVGTTTKVTATGALVEGQGDIGLIVLSGASTTVEKSALVENRAVGVVAQSAGANLTATDNLVTGTLLAAGTGDLSRGVEISLGAHATLGRNAIVGNPNVGLFVVDTGTEVTATGNLIAKTFPVNSRTMGVAVQEGATLVLDANAVVANQDVGLSAILPGSSAIATGCIIEGTVPRESDGQFGIGVTSTDEATLQLVSSLVHDNRVSALLVANAAASVSESLIDVVEAGSFTLFDPTGSSTFDGVGDGLLATMGSVLDITDTRVQGCARAGLHFNDSSGTLSGVVSTNNDLGLVLYGDRRPSYEGPNNQFTGNAAQDIVTDDLPVPDAPSPIPSSP